MSYQEKRTITSIVSGLILLTFYGIFAVRALRTGAGTADDWQFWAGFMLKFIGIGIALTIAIQILFHILISMFIAAREHIREGSCDDSRIEKTIKQEMVEDERDRLIELKSLKAGFIVAGVGFVASLGSLVLGYPPAVMLNVLFVSFFSGSVLEGFIQLHHYRKGF